MCACFSTICRATPYLLSCWTQIKAFHSNSLSGNRGTLHFIYKPSYVAAGTKRFIKVWHLSKRGKHHLLGDILAVYRSITTCHSITACRTCHVWHNLTCTLYGVYTHPDIWPVWMPSSVTDMTCAFSTSLSIVGNVLLGIMSIWRTETVNLIWYSVYREDY